MKETPELTIELVATDELVPYARNAKRHPAWQVEQIKSSIMRFGFSDPVGVWTNDAGQTEIVEGHGRVLAAKELGIDAVPVVKLDHLTDEERKAYTHIHNKLNENTSSDSGILKAELATINLPGAKWSDFGFEDWLTGYEETEQTNGARELDPDSFLSDENFTNKLNLKKTTDSSDMPANVFDMASLCADGSQCFLRANAENVIYENGVLTIQLSEEGRAIIEGLR